MPVAKVQVVILFDKVINTEQKQTSADSETRGDKEPLSGTDPGHAEGDHGAEEDDGALDAHQHVVIQTLAWLVEDWEWVCQDGVVACRLEEEHQGEAGEEWFVDAGIDVLPPGLLEGCVKHIHVCLNFFEEFQRVILPSKPSERFLRGFELGLWGEIQRGLGYEPDCDDEEEAEADPGEAEHPPVHEGAENVSVEDAGLSEQWRHHTQHSPEVQVGHLHQVHRGHRQGQTEAYAAEKSKETKK